MCFLHGFLQMFYIDMNSNNSAGGKQSTIISQIFYFMCFPSDDSCDGCFKPRLTALEAFHRLVARAHKLHMCVGFFVRNR